MQKIDGIKKRIVEESTIFKLPKAVVSPDFNEENVPLRDAWLGILRDKRDISSAISYTSKILPGMKHLKRCSGKKLILAFVASSNGQQKQPTERNERYLLREEIEDLLRSNENFDRSIFEEELEILAVPAIPARTKAQAKRASEIWPLNFHPDPYIENTLNGSCFDSNDLQIIDRCMKICIDVAEREACANEDCNGSAIIFNPFEGEIVALAASSTNRHPMWHAAMLAVDLVATVENGGAYEFSNQSVNRKRKYSSMSDLARKSPLVYPSSLADIVQHLSFPCSSSNKGQTDDSRYLCTNYWVFLLREPCPMCAMALVHSRVSNIFYGVANEKRGVLGSRALLHEVAGLNHRYRVWRGIREDACSQVCKDITRRCV